MRWVFLCWLLSSGVLWAQAPSSQPTPPPGSDPGTGEDKPFSLKGGLVLWTEEPLPAQEPYQNNALTLRNLNQEFAQFSVSSGGALLLGGVLPVEISSGANVRIRDNFRAIDGDLLGRPSPELALAGDYFSAGLQANTQLTKRLSVGSKLQADQSVIGEEKLSSVQPTIAIVYQPTKHLRLHVELGRGVNQLASTSGGASLLEGAPGLAPVGVQSTNIGGEYKRENIYLRLNTFHRKLSGIIEPISTGEGRGLQLVNVGDGFTSGMETEQRLSFGEVLPGFFLWSSQTLLFSEVNETGGVERAIQSVPLFVGSAGLRYQNKTTKTSASLSATYLGQRQSALTLEPADLLIDLAVRQKLAHGRYWYVSFENITNEQQVLADIDLKSGVAAPELSTTGRTFFTGIVLPLSAP